jgi:ABC-type transport system involved in multi-copper enzyme maturation permease subunit
MPTGTAAGRLIKAEMLKIWTTNAWWIFGIFSLGTTALALLINISQAEFSLSNAEQLQNQPMPDFAPPPEAGVPGPSEEDLARMRQEYLNQMDIGRILITSAASVYTSGQLFGLMFMAVLGAVLVSNEFQHQTATTTFLTTPHRTQVILAKFGSGLILATGFWLVTTLINVAAGSVYYSSQGYAVPLSDWPVLRSVLLNLLAYAVWAVFGVAFGVLIRSQLGSTLVAVAAYLLGYVGLIGFGALYAIFEADWVWKGAVLLPGLASLIMISPEPFNFGPPGSEVQWWAGLIVLIAYGIVAGTVGTLIARKRDIS